MTQYKYPKSKQPGEFTGFHMLVIMVLFFGVIISVNVFMAVSAMRSWTGLVVKNSYVASQQFNTKLTIARAQTEAGWQGALEYADGVLRFILNDGDGVPLVADVVEIAISRPIGVVGDQTLLLRQTHDGSYEELIQLAPGAWNAAIIVKFPDQPDYEHRARLTIGRAK